MNCQVSVVRFVLSVVRSYFYVLCCDFYVLMFLTLSIIHVFVSITFLLFIIILESKVYENLRRNINLIKFIIGKDFINLWPVGDLQRIVKKKIRKT